MFAKYRSVEDLAMSHLTRKTATYMGEYQRMASQHGAAEANQAIEQMAETLQMAGYTIRKAFPAHFPQTKRIGQWQAVYD